MSVSAINVLTLASLRTHRGRFLAAAIAIAIAASVLLSALESRELVLRQAPVAAAQLLGPAEVHLAATDTVFPLIQQGLLAELRDDPQVERIDTAVSVRAVDMPGTADGDLDREKFYSMDNGGMGGWIPGRRDNFLAWNRQVADAPLAEGEWPAPSVVDPIEIASPQIWRQPVGTYRRLESDAGVFSAKIVGTIAVDMAVLATPEGARLLSRQISPAAAERLAGGPRLPSDARIQLVEGADRAAFLTKWRAKVETPPGRLEFWDADYLTQAGLESTTVESARLAVISATMLAATCVVCITLGVQGSAVRERTEQLGLLRALGAQRRTLAGAMFAEAALLALVSVAGAALLSWGLLSVVGAILPFLGTGGIPSLVNVAITAAVILCGSILGTAWPVLKATQIWSTESLSSLTDPVRARRMAWSAALWGLVILAAVVLLVTLLPANTLLRARVAAWLGVPGIALAAICLTPLAIRSVGRCLAKPIAWLTRTNALVLQDQIAGDGARSAGAVLAMSVGLGGFIWMLVWGYSMLGSFVIDPHIPRWLVSIHPYGLDQVETKSLLATPTLSSFQPLTLVDTRLATADQDAPAVPTLVMGVDVERTLAGEQSLPFHFLAGDFQQAKENLATGEQCLLSDWYAASSGSKMGDQISIAVPSSTGTTERSYKVAGIIELRGWRMATKLNKVRLRGDKHRALVVLDANTVRRDFPVAFANFLIGGPTDSTKDSAWFRAGITKDEAYAASNGERDTLETAVAETINLSRPIEYHPDGGPAVVANKRIAQVDDFDRTRFELLGDWGGGAVKRMGILPLVILALSLTSVSGSLVVSFLSRARELGILRTCGLSRMALARLCLAVGLLTGIAAIPIAAVLGLGGAWLMLEVASVVGYRLDFAGIQPELAIPWDWLWPGLILTIVVSCLAALWATWRIGRVPPDALLTSSAGLR